jgi:hypothetical protein
MLALAALAIPWFVAWCLAGRDARRNLVGVDLLLAGLAGGAIGLFAVFGPAVLYVLGASYRILPIPGFVLDSNHMELAAFGLLFLAMLTGAWIGYMAGLAYVLLEMGRRREAGAVLFSLPALCLFATGVYAVLARFGVTWTGDFASLSILGIPPLIPAAGGLWLLATRGHPARFRQK